MMILEKLKNLSDVAKIFIALALQVIYITWWASGISSDVDDLKTHVALSTVTVTSLTLADVRITDTVEYLTKNQELLMNVMHKTIAQHAKCEEILNNVRDRIRRLEELEEAEHGRIHP